MPLITGMKHCKLLSSFSLVIAAAGPMHGEVNSNPANINPALTYYRAFCSAPDFSPNDRDYLYTNEWRGQKLPDRVGELLTQYDGEFVLLRQAAQATAPCDWGVDWSAGPRATLPHLPQIKKALNAADLRTQWDLQHDRATDAQEDLLAVLALGRHGAGEGCLIGALVQIAVERKICATIAQNFNHWSSANLEVLANALNGPPPRGSIAACIPMEKSAFYEWLVNQVRKTQAQNPGNDAKAMDELHQLYTSITSGGEGTREKTDPWPQIVAEANGTTAGVLKLLNEMAPLYARLATIEALPPGQYEEQMKPFSTEIQSSPNPFVHEFFPALEKCRPREFSALADMAMVQAAVQYKLHGMTGLESVKNPLAQGPFAFRRLVFDGVDRGFELNADYAGMGYPEVMDFVETDGPAFEVLGRRAGKPLAP